MYRTGAIVVAGNHGVLSSATSGQGARDSEQDCFASPLACVEVLGESVLERTVGRLRASGVKKIDVVTGPTGDLRRARNLRFRTVEDPNLLWQAAAHALQEFARRKVDAVLIAALGAYAEVDVRAAFEFHHTKAQAVTPLYDRDGALAWWIVEPARVLSVPTFSLPLAEQDMSDSPVPYFVEGYVNRLADARDLRRLTIDAFLGRCCIAPRGREIRPGIWVGDGVRMHKTARLVAPAFVGNNSRVQSSVVVTRFSNLERDCFIGEGSVVANASILPHTTIGRGLDISSALVKGSEFVDLSRNVSLLLQDPLLISSSISSGARGSADPKQHQHLHPNPQPEIEYSYLSRAAGRLLEVFKGEV